MTRRLGIALLCALAGCNSVSTGHPPADAGPCAEGQTRCGAACVELATDPAHCGGCDTACPPLPHAAGGCVMGACTLGACNPGFHDCDGQRDNGCEAALDDDAKNCGACGHVCQNVANGTPGCHHGECGVGSCLPNFADCDGSALNGCEASVLSDPTHCGTCGNVCGAVAHGAAACADGTCAIASCDPGYHDCDGQLANGCEVKVDTDLANCGGCGKACAFPHATATCVNAACVRGPCAPGFADCDQVAANGCEIDVGGDANNCGACDRICSAPNSASACNGGACVIGACLFGYADCNGQYQDGCESDQQRDLANCGACGKVCAVANGAPACNGGACAIAACNAGFFDCDGQAQDGCERDGRSDVANCGGCGKVCVVGNGVPKCTSGQCGIASCNGAFRDCDGLPGNGCEADTDGDVAHCGACGAACVAAHATPSCVDATCGIAACDGGYADCDGVAGNGCEIRSETDVKNCGGCGVACAAVANGTPACSGGACAIGACNAGFFDCDGQLGDGCELDGRADLANCGGCGKACTVANGTPQCAGGQCKIASCTGAFRDCDGNLANGCEADTNSDVKNCGACFYGCGFPNAVANCVNATCGIASCKGGFADCDGKQANGCEANLTADVKNCGGCGVACGQGAACIGGACKNGPLATSFAWQQTYSTDAGPLAPAIADFNGDGRLDIVVSNFLDDTLGVYLAYDFGGFVGPYKRFTNPAPSYLLSADFNGDGRPDVAVPAYSGALVNICRGVGDGTFTISNVAAGNGPYDITGGDFNGDGKLDLVVTVFHGGGLNSGAFYYYKGNGDGTFAAGVPFLTTTPVGITTADFNKDGRLDLAVVDGTHNFLRIFLGNDAGNFGLPTSYTIGLNSNGVTAADFNRDGKVDLAVTSSGDGAIDILLGNGDGTFKPQVQIALTGKPHTAAAADFNLDGVPDLAVTNPSFNPFVSVLIGKGDGSFQAPINLVTDSGPSGVAVADLDRDGRPDIVTANYYGDTISIFYNTSQ